MQKQIAIQGIQGSYHEIAARNHYAGETVDIIACRTFADVVAAIQDNCRQLGIMAIENTIAGSLLQNHELIRRSGLTVIGEHKLRISHQLAALPGTQLDAIGEVHSHPMAILQCRDFLETLPDLKLVETEDTASSARRIAEKKLNGIAAICSREAAKLFGLDILVEGIESDKHNYTRFLVIADSERAKELLTGVTPNKASLVFSLNHSVGSLANVLSVFSFYGLNLTKLQSFPRVGFEWQYLFYADLTFEDHARFQQAVTAVHPLTTDLNILGQYIQTSET